MLLQEKSSVRPAGKPGSRCGWNHRWILPLPLTFPSLWVFLRALKLSVSRWSMNLQSKTGATHEADGKL